MTVADDVTLDDLILAKDDLSGADIKVRDTVASATSKNAQFDEAGRNSFAHVLNITLYGFSQFASYRGHCLIFISHGRGFGAPVWMQRELQLLNSVKWQLL